MAKLIERERERDCLRLTFGDEFARDTEAFTTDYLGAPHTAFSLEIPEMVPLDWFV